MFRFNIKDLYENMFSSDNYLIDVLIMWTSLKAFSSNWKLSIETDY